MSGNDAMTRSHVSIVSAEAPSSVFAKNTDRKNSGPRTGKIAGNIRWEPWQKKRMIEMKLAGHSFGKILTLWAKRPRNAVACGSGKRGSGSSRSINHRLQQILDPVKKG